MSVGAADKETILASFARLKNAVDQLS
jgi:hypothetical protein